MGLLVVVADNVRMIVRFLKDGDFSSSKCDKVLQ